MTGPNSPEGPWELPPGVGHRVPISSLACPTTLRASSLSVQLQEARHPCVSLWAANGQAKGQQQGEAVPRAGLLS